MVLERFSLHTLSLSLSLDRHFISDYRSTAGKIQALID